MRGLIVYWFKGSSQYLFSFRLYVPRYFYSIDSCLGCGSSYFMKKYILLLCMMSVTSAFTQQLSIQGLITYQGSSLTAIDEYATKKNFSFYTTKDGNGDGRAQTSWIFKGDVDSTIEVLEFRHSMGKPNVIVYALTSEAYYNDLIQQLLDLKMYNHFKTQVKGTIIQRIYAGNKKFIVFSIDSQDIRRYAVEIYEYGDYISNYLK
jgi:hypothetical protein